MNHTICDMSTMSVAKALEALFQLHIIHRDIKPQNLLLSYPVPPPSPSSSSSAYPANTKAAFTDATIKLGKCVKCYIIVGYLETG